jgi:molybdopterin-containing oxidoreductase family membrane subunit
MTPDTLGEIYEYRPTLTEWSIAAGVFGVGFLVFTVLVKVAVPIMTGTFQAREGSHQTAPTPALTP